MSAPSLPGGNSVAGSANSVGGPLWKARRAILRPLAFVGLVAFILAPRKSPTVAAPTDRDTSVVRALSERHLGADPRSVIWIDGNPSVLRSRTHDVRALVRARRGSEPYDVYLARARVTPEGGILAVRSLDDLTHTSVASEELLCASGRHAAWAIGDGKRFYRVELADLGGEDTPSDEGWSRVAKVQRALANLQHTGQLEGVGRRSFKLDPAVTELRLAAEPTQLVVSADGQRISIPWERAKVIEGGRFVSEEPHEIAQPGNLLTWAVDRVRELPWFGDERMQLTKAIAYGLLDRIDRLTTRVRPRDESSERAEDLPTETAAAPPSDPEIGFPPAPVPPMVTPPFPEEGKWLSLENDPYFHQNPGVPPPLVTTHLRADGARPDSHVIIVIWDPRQVELDAVPGTEEPESATGETGTGMIPRKPELMKRLLGAFNGAFQSTHGDYGMQVDGALIVPPRPYAATIARTTDSATVFGTWPYDLTIPRDFVSFRQNLTPLVLDGKLNPYGREWWGGVPHDWEDETHTVRSGVCLTREGFIAYFYGTKIDHVHLGRVMIAARCDYGIHLDMNQGHTGLELYRVFESGALPSLSGKLDGHFEAEGDVLDMPGYRFRGRKLFRNMQLMHFPRYIRRGARDYFYLALRPVLPGAPLGKGDDAEDAWTVRGLPQGGFPYALATASLRPDASRPETKVRVLKIDPSVVRPKASDDTTSAPLVSLFVPAHEPLAHRHGADEHVPGREAPAHPTSLWLAARRAVIPDAPPDASAVHVASGSRSREGKVAAALAVDADGMVLYAEVATSPDLLSDGRLLEGLFRSAHAEEMLFLSSPLVTALSGSFDLAGHPVRTPSSALVLVRDATQRARRVFPETPVLPPQEWMPLQRQTRIFPKEPEAAAPSASAASPEP